MPKQPQPPQGKPTGEQDNHDENVGQREQTRVKQDGVKPSVDKQDHAKPSVENERGKNYGQREGSTVTEDNDVE